jgi:hypothetical protein
MRITVKIEAEVDIKTLHVFAFVRYWEDAEVNGEADNEGDFIPCKRGEMWCPVIDLDRGKIINWEQGKSADIHYKVCDAGTYELYDEMGKLFVKRENCYVPRILCPKQNGYGDYIIMKVDENGFIANFKADIEDLLDE